MAREYDPSPPPRRRPSEDDDAAPVTEPTGDPVTDVQRELDAHPTWRGDAP